MIKVLIVDDSIVSRQLLKYIFNLSNDFVIVAEAKDGNEALQIFENHLTVKPDVVTMDIEMPGIDGYETTKRILDHTPIPIVIISNAMQYYSAEKAFRALQAGAVAAVGKPPGLGSDDFYPRAKELIDLIRKAVTVKIPLRTRVYTKIEPLSAHEGLDEEAISEQPTIRSISIETFEKWVKASIPSLIAIGASTGGPPAIQLILSRLPADFPVPIIIVQHIASGLARSFSQWLDTTCDIQCKLAEDDEILMPCMAYVAPNDVHTVVSDGGRVRFRLSAPSELIVPSVDMLFNSVAENYRGRAIGILLTGMGRDGAKGLLAMRQAGALTFTQDKESSVVFGMPGEAEKLSAACCSIPPESIADMLAHISTIMSIPKEKE